AEEYSLRSACDVDRDQALPNILRMQFAANNGFPVWRPGWSIQSLIVGTSREYSFRSVATLHRSHDEPVLPRLGIVVTNEGNLISVRRKRDIRVNIRSQFQRRTSEQGSPV